MAAPANTSRRALIVEDESPIREIVRLHLSLAGFETDEVAARAADPGGGLGLSITKAIIERHGGTIRVTSQPGHTTFTAILPQSAVAG